jgi:hypothetical protein
MVSWHHVRCGIARYFPSLYASVVLCSLEVGKPLLFCFRAMLTVERWHRSILFKPTLCPCSLVFLCYSRTSDPRGVTSYSLYFEL